MSSIVRLLHNMSSMWCRHEWCVKHEPNRMYLECIQCGAESQGIEVRTAKRSARVAPPVPMTATPWTAAAITASRVSTT